MMTLPRGPLIAHKRRALRDGAAIGERRTVALVDFLSPRLPR
jgi:hypothetical protein